MKFICLTLFFFVWFSSHLFSNPIHQILSIQSDLMDRLTEDKKPIQKAKKEKLVSVHLLYHAKDKKIPFQLELNQLSTPSDRLISSLESARIRDVLIRAFKNRPEQFQTTSSTGQKVESNPSNLATDPNSITKNNEIEFEWLEAPQLDYHDYRYSFLARVLWQKESYLFGKVVFLLKDGIAQFQVFGAEKEDLMDLFKVIKSQVRTKDEFSYLKAGTSNAINQSWLTEAIITPIGSTPLSEEEKQGEVSTIEKNKQFLGYFFLAFAILFFMLINPGSSNKNSKQ